MGIFGFFSKEKKESLDQGLQKSSQSIFSKLSKAVVGKSKVDEEILDELEEVLITSDVGVDTTIKIIERIEERVARDKYVNTEELDIILREEIIGLLEENQSQDFLDFDIPQDKKPYVIMVVGVNGVGKTTTIGKLASLFKKCRKISGFRRSRYFPCRCSGPIDSMGKPSRCTGSFSWHEYGSCFRSF